MRNDWPTKELDMKMAAAVIRKHIELNDGEPLILIEELLEPVLNEDEQHVPEWIEDLTDCFIAQYGMNQGLNITNRVLTRCFLAGQTIH